MHASLAMHARRNAMRAHILFELLFHRTDSTHALPFQRGVALSESSESVLCVDSRSNLNACGGSLLPQFAEWQRYLYMWHFEALAAFSKGNQEVRCLFA